MKDSPVFDWVCERLEEATSLERIEAVKPFARGHDMHVRYMVKFHDATPWLWPVSSQFPVEP